MRPRTCRICIFYVGEAAVEGNKCIVWMCLYEGSSVLLFLRMSLIGFILFVWERVVLRC